MLGNVAGVAANVGKTFRADIDGIPDLGAAIRAVGMFATELFNVLGRWTLIEHIRLVRIIEIVFFAAAGHELMIAAGHRIQA